MHLESLSNGLGAQSMLLFSMACQREIPATVSITADTGWEVNRTWNTGRKSTILEYFQEVVIPMSEKYGIKSYFTRSRYKDGSEFETLVEHVKKCAREGRKPNIPLFGSRNGRLRQVCTDKWKIRALRQQARALGAKTNCNAQGIHIEEAYRRVKGTYIRNDGIWSIYQTEVDETVKNPDGTKTKIQKAIKWQTHYYPLVDLLLNRRDCQEKIVKLGIPYLLSSECDGCPHKDLTRWERTSPEVLQELSDLEKLFNGELFFTHLRIPLLEAISVMAKDRAANPEKRKAEVDFGCQNAICGV